MECELDTVAQVHVAQQSRRDKLRIQHPSPVMANHLHQQPRQRQMMLRNDRNENGGEAVVAYEYDPTSDAAIFPNIPPPPPQEILNSNPLTVDQRWKFMASPHQISFSAASSPLNTYHHQQNQLPPSLMNFPHHQQPQHYRRQLYQNAAPITGNNQRCDDELVLLPSSSSSSSSSYNVTVAGLLDHNHLDFPAANISRSEGLLPHHNSSNHPQALALSLSSNQWNCREMKGLGQQFVDVSNGGLHNNHDRNSKPLMNMPFPPEIPHLEIEVQTASVHHNSNTSNSDNNNNMNNMNNRNTMSNRNTTGPLGPFTGYATILKSSGFLKPAQDLLDEFCGLTTNHKLILPKASDDIGACSGDQQYPAVEVGVNKTGSCLDIRAAGDHNGGGAPPSPMSSSAFGATQICGEEAAAETSRISTDAWLPDFQQKKASLLHMQELVSRRYRQYKEQVQMVVSSFESVEGLSTAAPHVCASLKLLTRHFKWLKNAISSQLRHIGNALPSPSVEGDGSMSWRSFHSHRLSEPQQHLWRPQRGLPERSVAVLRAWLFDHFLHPYPTDTDKQMLATRAGLSRNQVSNWFINARVRLWKPMVEEIHMLETKGGSGEAPNPGRASKRTRMEREGGGAAVSLTLGLRNTAESSQQVQNLHFGGHMIGEFVG